MKHLTLKPILFTCCLVIIFAQASFAAKDSAAWQPSAYQILSPAASHFAVHNLGHPFAKQKNCIVSLAPELTGLTGVQLDFNKGEAEAVKLKLTHKSYLLIGVFDKDSSAYLKVNPHNDFGGKGKLVLKNALTITGLPPVNVYAFAYNRGIHIIHSEQKGLFAIIGVISAKNDLQQHDAGMPDGRAWQPFIVEGAQQPALFKILGGPDQPVIDSGMPGTEGIQGGFEGGRCVKVGDTYHLFPTERAGQKGVGAYYDRVKTRIGHWESKDLIHWKRIATLYQASGQYAVTDDDNPANDRRAAIWSYMPVFNQKENRWNGFYLAYTVSKTIEPNHCFGRIWRTVSKVKGLEGIGGPYIDSGIVMEPGLNSQLWEGRQGVDSFFPFPVDGDWLAFYGGAYPWSKWSDYPYHAHKGWFVGLAKAPELSGPWKRLDTTINPVTSINPFFIENPIVSQLPGGLYIAIFDGGPDAWGLHEPNMFAYTLSKDGIHWTEAHYLPIQEKVNKWWDIMRTPLCLIPEGDNVYSLLYAAIEQSKRFHPIGLVRLKLQPEVLKKIEAGSERTFNY